MSKYNYFKSPDTSAKLVCAACYLTGGIAGLIYSIANGTYKDATFFRFHFLQAIMLGIIQIFISMGGGILVSTLTGILSLFGSATAPISGAISDIFILALNIISKLFLLCALVGIVQSLRGKNLELPGISILVRQNMR
ncbi:MAG: hypothetical protein LCH63_12200 [Candidatus Melainabacteria bacterium]|jgi:uncharacterized membrane protein|uniref:DUF4870 domain-containing protein n=1 Tax=Candidatus Obscuribacter phosphatis TaxID=1906157 RepID=A0A8J7P6N1_9BACT|nr:hypothetical protein [Candidatus Obscuribacter phosphatis]MCA0314578.1 hypothetical protein [Candidatus Melainabacteria bacterium]OPZ90499.1 MAG: Chloroplast import component protein (Tic20) [bacterium ADurb.Bin425]